MLRALALCLSLFVLVPRVHAQEPLTDARDEEARSLFEAGRTAYRDGRFEDARDHFRRAYELSHRGELLYNVAQAEDRLRHDEAALDTFERFLVETPEAENRAEVEGRIAALRAAIAARTPAAPPDDAPPPSPSGPTVIYSWIVGGAALVTGALAVGFWVAANDQYGGLERGCYAGGGCTPAEVSASGVETSIALTNVFLVSSLVLAAATAVVLPIELTSSSSSGGLALGIGPGSLSLSGAF